MKAQKHKQFLPHQTCELHNTGRSRHWTKCNVTGSHIIFYCAGVNPGELHNHLITKQIKNVSIINLCVLSVILDLAAGGSKVKMTDQQTNTSKCARTNCDKNGWHCFLVHYLASVIASVIFVKVTKNISQFKFPLPYPTPPLNPPVHAATRTVTSANWCMRKSVNHSSVECFSIYLLLGLDLKIAVSWVFVAIHLHVGHVTLLRRCGRVDLHITVCDRGAAR